ncbi:MAG TPA: hypothetical protein PKY82_13190 [Pyrinomonadaceae bacterium]|nr:hypothetical protein [Pyrinomonadaceae bacterium]
MKNASFRWFILLLAFSNTLFLQAQVSDEKRMRDEEKLRQDTQRASEKQQIDRIQGGENSRTLERTTDRIDWDSLNRKLDNIKSAERERKELEKFRSPDTKDIAKYSEFLKQKNTGIGKLLSLKDCGNSNVVNINQDDCFFRIPALTYYSFRDPQYYVALADLKYENQNLLVGFEELNFGMIGELGDISLDSLNKETPEVVILRKMSIPKKRDQLQAGKKEITKGIEVNGKMFFDHLDIHSNQTYLLRSYNYRIQRDFDYLSRIERDYNYLNSEIDVIVAFRIVRVDENNDLTIVWKRLYKGDTRQI